MESASAARGAVRILAVSDEAENLLGYSREDLVSGRVRLADCVSQEDATLLTELLGPRAENRCGGVNLRLRHADGGMRCVKAQCMGSGSAGEGQRQMQLLFEDACSIAEPVDAVLAANFAEAMEARRKLQESEESLREAQRIAGLGSFEYDLRTRTWSWSEESRRIIGAEEGTARTSDGFWALIYPEDRGILAERLEGYYRGERSEFDREYRIVRQCDGAVRWVHTRGRLEFDAAEEPVVLRGTLMDITEKKLAECALRESEAMLKDAQRIAGLGSYVLDGRTGMWSSSESLNEVLGIGEEYDRSLAGWLALVHPNDRAKMAAFHARAINAGQESFTSEFRIIRPKDQTLRWMLGEGRMEFDAAGKLLRLRGTLQDITARKQTECALRQSKELLQLFIEHAPATLAMFDRQMRYVAVSRRWIETWNLHGKELVGRSAYEIFPFLPESWKENHQRVLAGETFPAAEFRFPWPDGGVQWLRRELRPWRDGEGKVGGVVVLAEDITQQREAEERLRLASTVFTHATEGIVITDAAGSILEVNEAFTRITGYEREEVLGANPRILQSGLHTREFFENMWHSLEKSGHWKGEIWNRNKRGEIFAEELTINAIRDGQGRTVQYVALFSDVTRLKEQERQLEHMAHYDALTGLPNRTLLVDRLRQGMAQANRRKQVLAVATLDLDEFKAINDRYGHDLGDRLLTTLARRIRSGLRLGDTLARLGGDEFAVVMTDLGSAEDAAPVLERLLRDAAEAVRIGRLHLRVTASIGVTFYPQAEEADAEQLLRQAHQALFDAKADGRNCYSHFDPKRNAGLRGRQQELEAVRRAVARREFVLHYQPKVNMRTGAVVGAEALIRWQHPQHGLLSPGAFLPLIENDALSIRLGEWVIDTALRQIEEWQAIGLDIPVSVNVGALQLQQKDFPEQLRRLLAAHPTVKPSSLELEVLETSALQDLVQASNVLEACHAMGVSFAIDDFGTGYASLTYLKRLPAQTLKIEQSFVRDMLDDPENPTILEGVLSLASAFRRKVVAEGVETVEHGWMLLQLGCEVAQGYGIARAMPAAEIPEFVATWRPDPRWTDSPAVHSGNRTLRFACVEHRAWLGALESYLDGKRHAPPTMDPAECRFKAWLEGERLTGRLDLAAFAAIETLHQQLHALAAEILASHRGSRSSGGVDQIGALQGLGHEFLSQLTGMN